MPFDMTRQTGTFPTVRIPSPQGRTDIQVSLIAQLGHGEGDHLYANTTARQRQHAEFVDELEEPSAKLAGTNFPVGDASSLYSFSVGSAGHPFHRHAGNRIFTAISGSGGALLRFSTASDQDQAADPQSFVDALHHVHIPPDCLFTVRFGGMTWHQFSPLTPGSPHPVFFALSCHPDELGGDLPAEIRQQVLDGKADIPSLTELLPDDVRSLLEDPAFDASQVATSSLSLDAPEGSLHRAGCNGFRSSLGRIRSWYARHRQPPGYNSTRTAWPVTEHAALSEGSLLADHLQDRAIHHQDSFVLDLRHARIEQGQAESMLASLLDGFLENAPRGVGRLMALRNVLVKPIGLRTSPVGCPVSSLLTDTQSPLFAGRFRVIDQRVSNDGNDSQVILGADDRPLVFRSSVRVTILSPGRAEIALENRVSCNNLFGRFYMAAISRVHRRYIAPTMLRMAVDHVYPRSAMDG